MPALLRLMENLMRAFLSRSLYLLLWLFGVGIPLLIILRLFQGDIIRILQLAGFAFVCVGVPFLGVVGFLWVMAQLGKMAVDSGREALQQRKRPADEVWLDVPHTLNYDGRYTIGDDGELIELSALDEKYQYDNTAH